MRVHNYLKITFLALVINLLNTGCKKDNSDKHDKELRATATVIDGGNPAADGCGWLIKVGDINYSPDNLPENFKVNNITVDIRYSISERKFACGFNANGPNFIHLYDIKR